MQYHHQHQHYQNYKGIEIEEKKLKKWKQLIINCAGEWRAANHSIFENDWYLADIQPYSPFSSDSCTHIHGYSQGVGNTFLGYEIY